MASRAQIHNGTLLNTQNPIHGKRKYKQKIDEILEMLKLQIKTKSFPSPKCQHCSHFAFDKQCELITFLLYMSENSTRNKHKSWKFQKGTEVQNVTDHYFPRKDKSIQRENVSIQHCPKFWCPTGELQGQHINQQIKTDTCFSSLLLLCSLHTILCARSSQLALKADAPSLATHIKGGGRLLIQFLPLLEKK